MIKLAALVGSLRKDSYSLKLAKYMQKRYADCFEIQIINLNLPLFNEDLQTEVLLPDQVRTFHNQIEVSDAVLFITPEYNHAVSGVLKNALDWASRPAPNQKGLIDKVGLIASTSMYPTSGILAYYNLHTILNTLPMNLLPGNEIFVGFNTNAFDERGSLKHPHAIDVIDGVMEAFEVFYQKKSQQ